MPPLIATFVLLHGLVPQLSTAAVCTKQKTCRPALIYLKGEKDRGLRQALGAEMVSRGSALEPPQAPSLSGTRSDASAAIGPTTDLADASAPSPPDGATKGWIRPAETPTQDGPNGVKFDFNSGARVLLPKGGAPWKVGIGDLDTGNILFQTKIEGGRVNSAKRTYVRIRIEVERQGETPFVHDYDAAGRGGADQFPRRRSATRSAG